MRKINSASAPTAPVDQAEHGDMAPPSTPKLTEGEKFALARAYAAGEPLAALVTRFRCWTAQARYAVTKHGYPLRPEDRQEKRCRICGDPVLSCTKRSLCAVHVRSFCSRCEDALPVGRANRWCAACEAAHKEALWQTRGRLCALCGKAPATTRTCRCQRCQDADYQALRQVRLKYPGTCQECGTALPPGRIRNRCVTCWRRHERARRRDRQAHGEHRCVMCGEGLGIKQKSYCRGCQTMLQNWRRSWHRKNPIARRLGTVEKRRKWQQEQKEE